MLTLPVLCLVTDRALTGGAGGLPDAVSRAVAGGVNMVQLREKDLPQVELLPLAKRLRDVTLGRAVFVVNSSVDVALAAGADAVQLPEGGVPVSNARKLAGPVMLAGRSVHDLAGAVEAEHDGADFLILGTLFTSRTHPEVITLGLDGLRAVCGAVRLPVIGIGGITAENAGRVMEAGASGVAVISAILAAGDPEEAAAGLKTAVSSGWRKRPRQWQTGGPVVSMGRDER